MNTFKLSNISISKLKLFLEHQGLKHIGTKGGHLKYSRKDLSRPIIFQSHIDPVPEFIVSQIIKTLGFDKKSFNKYIKDL